MNLIFTILFLFISGTVYAQECTQPSCFQQKDKELTGLANTTSAADRVPWYIDANGNMDLAPFTAYGRSVVGAPDAAAARALLGVTVGGSAHEIEDEGNSVIQRSIMNFTGAGVTATDSGGKTTIDIPGIGGHVIKNEGSALTTQPNLNFVGSGIDCINDAGNSETECTVSAGAEVDPVVGAIKGVVKSDGAGNISTATASDLGAQPVDADLTALAGNSTAGFWVAATNVVRSFADGTGIAWTNPAGTAGNPTANVTAAVMMTSRAATLGNFDYNFAGAASLTIPGTTGCAPTIEGRICTNTTSHRATFGNGTITRTFAFTDEIQPLNANLTALAGLTGSAQVIPRFTGPGAMSTLTLPTCADTGGNHWNFDGTSIVCGTSGSGSLSGGTPGALLKYATASTAQDSILTEAAGTVTVGGGLVVGTTPFLIVDTSAIASSDKTLTAINVSGTLRPTTGAVTTDHVVTFAADGSLKDGGAAGAGDVVAAGPTTLEQATIANVGVGAGTNIVTLPIAPYWPSGSLILPSTSTCTLGAVAAINSGPSIDAVVCSDAATSIFEGNIVLKQAVTTVTFTLTVNDVDSSSQHFGGGFKAMCRNNNTAVNATWGTAQTVDITMATANNNYTGTTAAVTPNGTCSVGATLFWQFVADNAGTYTDDGDARVIGVLMKQAS